MQTTLSQSVVISSLGIAECASLVFALVLVSFLLPSTTALVLLLRSLSAGVCGYSCKDARVCLLKLLKHFRAVLSSHHAAGLQLYFLQNLLLQVPVNVD